MSSPAYGLALLAKEIAGWLLYQRALAWFACFAVICLVAPYWRELPEMIFWLHPLGGAVVVMLLIVLVAVPFWTGHDGMNWLLQRCRA